MKDHSLPIVTVVMALAVICGLQKNVMSADAPAFRVGTPEVLTLYPYQPANYDGPIEQSIRISAARRDIESFELLVIAGDQALRNVQVNMSDLVHENNPQAKIGRDEIVLGPMAYVKTKRVLEPPDPSLQVSASQKDDSYEPRILRRDLRQFDVQANSQQTVWINIDVPPDALPGIYRGEATIDASGGASKRVPIELTVYNFTLPLVPTLPALTKWSPASYDPAIQKIYPKPDEIVDCFAKFMIRYRWRVGRIYQGNNDSVAMPDADVVKRWTDWGGTDVNLLRIDISDASAQIETDPKTQKRRLREPVIQNFYSLLDDRVKGIKQAGLIDNCYFYGFDERPVSDCDLIDHAFQQLKKRYGASVRTTITSYRWTAMETPQVRSVDEWYYVKRLVSPELLSFHHQRGEKIGWYNLSSEPLLPARVQFWATFKDKLDGVLMYSMSCDDNIERVADEPFPLIDKANSSAMHCLPDGPTSTTILEMWREGLEDVDFLHLLAEQAERVRAKYDRNREPPEEIAKLLAQADYYAAVPDTITTGIFAEAAIYRDRVRLSNVLSEEEGTAARAELLNRTHTNSMKHIMDVRDKIAQLIVRLGEIDGAGGTQAKGN